MIIQTMIGAVQGDSTPPLDTNYPVPGSGSYTNAITALAGIVYADIGTPYEPTGSVVSVQDSFSGLRRRKYDGNFTTGSLDTVSSYNLTFFNGLTPMASISDTLLSWGQQMDGPNPGQSNFSIEWNGYIQVPTTQNYNLYITSDDTSAVWIGDSAVTGFDAVNCIVSSSNKSLPGQAASTRSANSLTLDSTKWYPVRIWFSEFTGGCKFQMYLHGADDSKLYGEQIGASYCSTSGNGYNP